MSSNPTRVDWEETADPASPLQEGNRVLESIAQQEALRALLAFSDLHEQIRNRRMATGVASDRDLFETERFILDEVLQLICNRAQAITQADSIVVALAEGTKSKEPVLVCRASAGPLAIERGVHLIGNSEFLRGCLESGRILRCDDCATDPRLAADFARQIGARSSVLIPLRGRREQLGVLQAFSTTPRAFTDHDVRCFDLFAELVLSALKPEDQDRRIYWLADIADEVLQTKPASPQPLAASATEITTPAVDPTVETGLAPSPVCATTIPAAVPVPEKVPPVVPPFPKSVAELAAPAQPAAAREDVAELPETAFANELLVDERFEDQSSFEDQPVGDESSPTEFRIPFAISEPANATELPRSLPLPFLQRLSLLGSSRPGLSVVMGLVVVAALFSAGAWWGMQVHGTTASAKEEISKTAISRQSVTAPPAPPSNALSPGISDNLMNASKAGPDPAPLSAVTEDKLAALPKITGVRHWSSSMGSTVVIDMDDQVPYEVHRLMSPERIYFDLHDTVLSPDLDGKTMDVGDASLTRVRVAQPVAGVTRIVLDTKDGSNFSVSMESSPYRLVVELRGSDKSLTASQFAPKAAAPKLTSISAPAPAPLKAAPVVPLVAKAPDQPLPAKTGKFRIVLDAGHGGWDLGTVGREGLLEKDLVLDVTERLGQLLRTRLGSEVMFTRTDDTYLPLEQRADIANHAQADLFVSVHANYSSSAAARGVETYYTNLFSAPGSRELEKHDDGTLAKLTPVSLTVGGLHEKTEESRRLATSVQHSLYATLAARSPDIRNRGIKDSAFAVLTGTTMPAILTEISFVSSPTDERNLQSATYRQQIAEALYQGIARYQQSSPHTKVAQLQKPATR